MQMQLPPLWRSQESGLTRDDSPNLLASTVACDLPAPASFHWRLNRSMELLDPEPSASTLP